MKVCVDPGHGMSNRKPGVFDPGATHDENGFLYKEAEIALRYALALKDAFRSRGVDVYMTRDDSTDHAPVGMRASMAKAAGCDVFISIHLNDFDDDKANGMEVLFASAQGKKLASALLKAMLPIAGLKDRGLRERKDLAVLKFSGPAALIELGFIANDSDREKLLNTQVRDSLVNAIADTVISGQPL